MFNPINFTNEVLVSAATTLGASPGNTIPAQMLICTGAAGYTVTLPPVSAALASQPTVSQPVVPGVSGGYRITVFNQMSGSSVTVAAAGSDTITNIVSTTLTTQYAQRTYQASPLIGGWIQVA